METPQLMDCINASAKSDFTIVSNEILRDETLSFKAKGILALLLSNRDGWKSYKSVIIEMSKDGKDSVESGLKELENSGYLKRMRVRDANNRFAGYVWAYTDDAFNFNIDITPITDKGFSVDGFSVSGESASNNTNSKKTNNKKKKDNSANFQLCTSELENYFNIFTFNDSEIHAIKLNHRKYNVESILSLSNQFYNHMNGEYGIDVILGYNDIKLHTGLKSGVIGLMFMYANDFEKFENIIKSIY